MRRYSPALRTDSRISSRSSTLPASARYRQVLAVAEGFLHIASGFVHPQVVEVTQSSCRIESSAAKKPEISAGVFPTYRELSCSGHIACGCCALSTIDTLLIGNVGPADPRPLSPVEFPQVIEVTQSSCRIVTSTAKEPEISARVCPTGNGISCSGHIARARRASSAVNTLLIDNVGPADPRPLGPVEFPQVVEPTQSSCQIVTIAAKEPEISVGIYPTGQILPETNSQSVLRIGGAIITVDDNSDM
jgi:hypothetical protein